MLFLAFFQFVTMFRNHAATQNLIYNTQNFELNTRTCNFQAFACRLKFLCFIRMQGEYH
jgi:hypothetical protein